ncbi:PREDICTED: uncharacterized protein LOC109483184 [Branchiostoma belcheri]|uniref:Uncharacterized protein LOC109483184 n=1 Tax=Branchiostoma belcheri TaxID=7741 RepID=A0A6P4ZXX4_BRABE|nr:PREDICTED: uncharacterized protein LOC109483184 [Branchiostoma belcheri]
MYEQAEPVRSPFSGPDSRQSSGPTQPRPVPQSGSRGRVRHGNGASDHDKQREDQDTSSHTYEDAEEVKRYATSADRAYPGGASGRRGVCSFLRARRSCLAAGIAVLLSLGAVGLAPLTFSNKQEISQLSTTFDALKRDQDDLRQLSITVDALKRDQDDMSTTVDALKRDQDDMSTSVHTLKRDQDDMSTSVHTLKRDQDDMSTTVDALKRDQDDMSTTVDALKRDQDDMSTTVDALKRDLNNERNRTATLEQRLHKIEKTLPSCPEGYTIWRGICYKAFNIRKTFDQATAACCADGGTLAMPRDADTNAFLVSLYKSVRGVYWIGLHDQREEGKFEWMDGSALGPYNSWALGRPYKFVDVTDCVVYCPQESQKDKWCDFRCKWSNYFICQAAPVEMYEQAEPVRSPFSGPGSRQTFTSRPPPQPRQSGSRGRVRHGNGASDKQVGDQGTPSHTYEDAEEVKRYATPADRSYPGGASVRHGVCSFLRARRSTLAAGIAVLLSLGAVGLAPLTFSNKQEISQLSTTFDALKRDQDDMSTTVDALKRDQDDMSTTVDALKRDQDDMSTSVHTLKRDQDDMSTTVDALKRDQDDMSTTVDALKRDQDDMSTTVDALKRDLNNERNRTATLEQRLHKIEKTRFPASCPEGYTIWHGICYKAFNTRKTFDQATAACGADGGTLAMPRDADTNGFLVSLYKSVSVRLAYWIGLHDQREEGKFEWMDGSALGSYSPWMPRQPNNWGRNKDCVIYPSSYKDKWAVYFCDVPLYFICQTAPGPP